MRTTPIRAAGLLATALAIGAEVRGFDELVDERHTRVARTSVASERVGGAGGAHAARQATPRVNPDALLIGEFQKLVEQYLEIHKKADATLPEAPSSAPPDQVEAHRRAVERLIAQARAKAGQGDIFTQPIRAYFRRQISRALSGPDGAQVRATIMEENPGRIRLRINGPYPDAVPISTMPPRILASLPKLPAELEYRFIGERLILLDIHVQLVVDYMDDAVPR